MHQLQHCIALPTHTHTHTHHVTPPHPPAHTLQDPDDPYKGQYDEELLLFINDQAEVQGDYELRSLQEGGMMVMGAAEDPLLCRNVSSQDWSDAPYYTVMTNGNGWVAGADGRPEGSAAVLRVEAGKRYRVRTIQGSASWGLKVKVDGHGMDLIALDGVNAQRTPAAGFVLTPGERLDFILDANQVGACGGGCLWA